MPDRAAHSVLILGPTAGGKSALAIELALRIPGGGECISADSMQVYRGMDIGTAKTPLEQRRGVPHHLIDIVDPCDDSFSVDRWLALCDCAIADIRARGRTPIIVGGTNLYVQALLMGIAETLPAPHAELRARLNQMSPDDLRARLVAVDPAAAQRIHFNDRKRTVRAIEVFEQTGTRLSDLQTQWDRPPHADASTRAARLMFIIGLEYPVAAINGRINARVKAMIDAGFVDEVRRLHANAALGRNAREALGYKQVIEHIEGRCTLEDAIEQIRIRTRRYAKQQRTWLRRFRWWKPSAWLDAEQHSGEELAAKTLQALEAGAVDAG